MPEVAEDLAGALPGGLPPLTELLAWTTDHLIEGAAYLEQAAELWEHTTTSMWRDVHMIGWEGQAADGAKREFTGLKTEAEGAAERARAAAREARTGAADVLRAHNALGYGVDDAQAAGFTVYDNYIVDDPTGAHEDEAHQAADTIYQRAKELVGVDTHVGERIRQELGDLDGLFDEPDIGSQPKVYLADHGETLDDEGDGELEPPALGLPPPGLRPPVDGKLTPGEPSRAKERRKGATHLWDERGGEWRYHPEDSSHNPHWDYNPHDNNSSKWDQRPIGGLPPMKPDPLPPPQSSIGILEPNLSPVEKAAIEAAGAIGAVGGGLWWVLKHAAHPFVPSPS